MLFTLATGIPSSLPDSTEALIFGVLLGSAGVAIAYETLRIPNLKDQILDRDKSIDNLKTRLKEIEPIAKYSTLTNTELKSKTLTHIKRLKEIIDHKHSKETLKEEYKENFKPKTLALRDELWERLPFRCKTGESCVAEKLCKQLYAKEINKDLLETVIDDLRRLAHILPD